MSTIIKRRKDVRNYSRLSTGEIAHIIQNGMLRNEAARPEIIFAADYSKRGGKVEPITYFYSTQLRMHIDTDGARIDTTTPIDYPQLYAQLMAEISSGRRNEPRPVR